MNIDILVEKVRAVGILPVFCPKDEAELDTFLCAVLRAGLPTVEITLRSAYAPRAIERIKSLAPTLFVGAGTVMTEAAADTAKAAGADFLVSPGYTPELVRYALDLGLPFIPGCATPSEIQNAVRAGLSVLKLFPAECAGGTALLSLYAGAFSSVTFIPTGGITKENLKDYLAERNVAACGGSFMIDKKLLADRKSEAIAEDMKRMMRK